MRGRPFVVETRVPDGDRTVTDDGDGGTASKPLPEAAATPPLLPLELDDGLPDTSAVLFASGRAANDESPVAPTRPAVPLLAANEASHCGTSWPDLSITSATPPAAASS